MNARRHYYLIAAVTLLLVWLALSGGAGAARPVPADPAPPGAPPPIDCSRIKELGIDRMTNLRAGQILIECGYAAGGRADSQPHPVSSAARLAPNAYGGADVDVILPDGVPPHLTQSESFVWGNGTTIVVNYNDSRTAPSCYSGISWSTDNGVTWHPSQALCAGHGTNLGDPIVVYNARLATWYAGDLALGCGGGSTGGIGLWTSANGQTWSTGACAHTGTADDRESMWVDNNPVSPFYGRMYISWNNFAVASQRIFVTWSDDGTTWSAPVSLNPAGGFVRNGQVSGSPNGDGTVFVSGHPDAASDTTYMFRSTNGGVSWTQITVNSYTQAGGTVGGCSFRAIAPIWRAPAWGQPAVSGQIAGQNVVHYIYAAQGAAGDLGDTLYVRSTDNGSTWSVPLKLNTDATTQSQWQPSISALPNGAVFAAWYDRRNTSNGTNYEYWGRLSTDNGATWQPDMPISDVLITQPAQPDPNVQACYAGDYNYHSAFGTSAFITWTDGRTLVGATNTQDVEFDLIPLGIASPTPTATNTPTRTPTATNTPTSTNTPTRTPTATNTPTVTPTQPSFLIGHVTWQGRPAQPNALNQLPLTLVLRRGADPSTGFGLMSDASGFFTAPVTILPTGVYTWWVKGPPWLATSGMVNLNGASSIQQEMGLQRAGDVDNNNLVDIVDFTLLRATFGLVCSDTGFDGRADWTGDCLVDIIDFTLHRGNFGLAGPPPP